MSIDTDDIRIAIFVQIAGGYPLWIFPDREGYLRGEIATSIAKEN
jgi:hypothetical protein